MGNSDFFLLFCFFVLLPQIFFSSFNDVHECIIIYKIDLFLLITENERK